MEDKALLKLMKDAGFNSVCVGIESGNEEDLKLYGKRATVDENHLTLKLLREAEIYCEDYGFIMFNPYSTLASIKKNYEFLVYENSCEVFHFINNVNLYKGTSLFDRSKLDNLLIKSDRWYMYEINKYTMIDNDVRDIFAFIKNKFNNEKMLEIINFSSSFIYNYCMLSLDMDAINEHSKIRNNLSKIINEFFYYLYVENDINYGEKVFDEFLNELKNANSNFSLLRNKLFKKLSKAKIIKL